MTKADREALKTLAEIVEKRGNFAEVNYARKILGKRPISSKKWTEMDIAGMGG